MNLLPFIIFPAEEDATCCVCQKDYPVDKIYLCGPDHYPYDGNSNMVCEDCIDPEAEIVILENKEIPLFGYVCPHCKKRFQHFIKIKERGEWWDIGETVSDTIFGDQWQILTVMLKRVQRRSDHVGS